MKLNYADIPFDAEGRVEVPELMLRTLHGETIGLIPGAAEIDIHIKLSEPSELKFDVPAELDGVRNPIYDRLTGHKQIYTTNFGIYETLNISTENDGTGEVKHVTAYSLEKALSSKKFFLEEGTFGFYNQVSPTDENTIIGRVLEKAIGWNIGYVSSSLYGVYRTFEQVDDELLNFIYSTIDEKYQCCPVFDTYNKTISFYDRNEDQGTLPIYFDHDNLIDKITNEEKSEELVTALRPYGADELSIREVNPTGSPWIYDLTNFIENGDMPADLVTAWRAWEAKIAARREYYIALISLRASTSARLIAENATLAELQNELETLESERSAIVQQLGLDPNSSTLQTNLRNKTTEINNKKTAISTQQTLCNTLANQLDQSQSGSYAYKIKQVVDDLALTNTANFTVEQQEALQHYFIEQDLTEDTFVATDIDKTITGTSMSIIGSTTPFAVTNAEILKPSYTDEAGKSIYMITGGNLEVSNGLTLSGKIIGGTLEANTSDTTFVFSLHCGEMTVGGSKATDLMLTASGTYYGDFPYLTDVAPHTIDGVTQYIGTKFTFRTRSASVYVTGTTSEFKQFTVERELYDFAVNELKGLATYTYEFKVDAANFLFSHEFDQFRNNLDLGKGIYINLDGTKVVTPLIEMSFSFDDESKMDLVFSNRIKRHDPVNTLKDMIEKSYSTTRSIDAGKHLQTLVNNQASTVSQFMNASLDAAKNRIIGAGNQSVTIDGAGIHIGETGSQYQVGIVNNMIAMTSDNWQTAKLALGLFQTPNNGTYFGINADVIAGKLIVGQNMTIDTGDGSFKVDSSGVYIDSLKFYVRPGGSGSSQSLDSIISGIESEIEGTVTTYYQNTVPSNPNTGDLWFVTGTTGNYKVNELYRWSGSTWNKINDAEAIAAASAAASAANAASNAQATADSKIETFRQTGDPASSWSTNAIKAKHVGDIWYNTSTSAVSGVGSKKAARYTNTGTSSSPSYSWQSIEDGDIPTLNNWKTTTTTTLSNIIDTNGYLKATQLKGAISATNATMQSGTGNVLFDSKGIYLLNAATKSAATKAVWMNNNGILFGSGAANKIDVASGQSGAWNWTTAIGHDGIIASAIAAGTLSGQKIVGGSIFIPSESSPKFKVDTAGNLTATTGTFSGTVKGAAFQTSAGVSMMESNQWKADYLNLKGLNINNNFKVDSNGNVTLSSGASIQWGSVKNAPNYALESEIANFITSSQASTIVTNTLVASPTIIGATIKGGTFQDTNAKGMLNLTSGTYDKRFYFGSPGQAYSNSWFGITGYDDGGTQYADIFFFGANMVHKGGRGNSTFWPVGTWKFGGYGSSYSGCLVVPYTTGTPGSSTPGYGEAGAVCFKI